MTATNQQKSADTTALVLSPSTKAVNTQLEALRKEGAHILQAGAIQRDIPLHQIVVSTYKIELVPDGKFMKSADKEVYWNKGEFSLTRVAYDRFAQRACIQWVWRECMRIAPLNNPRYCAYRAVGKVMDLSGRWRVQVAEKAIDMDIVEQELRDNYRGKAKDFMEGTDDKSRDFQRTFPHERDRVNWVEEKVRIDALQIQKHMLARAQTGAMNRVVQKLLSLKSSYTKEELSKPFVFAALTFQPDPNHPMDRRYMLDQGSGMADMMYNAPAMEAAPADDPLPDPQVINAQAYPLTALDEEEAEIVSPPKTESTAAPSSSQHTETSSPSSQENQRLDFSNLDVKEQVENLLFLIKAKNYSGKITGDMAKWKPEQRMKFYDALSAMPNSAKPKDDLPFER